MIWRNNWTCLLLDIALGTWNRTARARLHSETPGMMIDRLSILSLKLYHTHEESRNGWTRRPDMLSAMPSGCKILEMQQRFDLASCLDHLWRCRGDGRAALQGLSPAENV